MRNAYWGILLIAMLGVGGLGGWAMHEIITNPPGDGDIGFYAGPIYPVVEGLATDDTTDYDSSGTYEFWTADSNPRLYESALTWGTDTHTTLDYESDQEFYFVCKSTVANAFDHYSWKITLPDSKNYQGPLVDISWDSVNEKWDVVFYLAKEDTPTLKCFKLDGTDVGTTAQDLSDRDYVLEFELKLSIAANYGGIGYFFDSDEGADGEWDRMYIIMTANISAANAGWTIDDPWKVCSDGKSYYLDLSEYMTDGLFVRWDEQQMDGVIKADITFHSSDIDTSGTGDALFTFNVEECNDADNAFYQTWETDTLTNLAGSVTAETLEVQD